MVRGTLGLIADNESRSILQKGVYVVDLPVRQKVKSGGTDVIS
jgi:hypothetical protein